MKILNRHALPKKKILSVNQASHVSKVLRKTIMKRSCLENLYFEKAYKKQKTYCSRLYKKERKNSVSNFNQEFVFDNKLFRKTVKPLFSNKGSYNFNIKLTDKDEIIRNEWLFQKCCFQFQIK